MREDLIKKLISSLKCTSCDQHYNKENIDIIERSHELWFLRVFCPSCHAKSIIAVIIKADKTPGAVTDLTEAEQLKFREIEAVGADDALDMYNFLKEFNGDFSQLFQSK